MKTKTLFVLVGSGGDGSYHTRYTFDAEWIAARQQAYDNGELDEEAAGCDGDGFHYKELQVPVECTYESLGIRNYAE